MAERDRPVYCAQCGSIVNAGNNFCGVCGARVPPNAQSVIPTQQIPTRALPPRDVSTGGNNRTLAMIAGLAILFVLVLGVGAIVGLNLLRSEPDTGNAAEPPRQRTAEQDEGGSGEQARASQPAADPERLHVGDSVEAEGVRVTLNGVRVLPTTDFDRPVESPDNLFVATDLTFENVSDQPISVSSLLELVLKNEEGYSASQSMHTQQRKLAEGQLAPGQIVYEVPPGSRGLQLDYRPVLQEDTHTWYIGDADALPQARAPQTEVKQTGSPSASAAPEEVPAGSGTEVVEAAEDYYQAVDSQTRAMFIEEEWYLKRTGSSQTARGSSSRR